MNGTEEIDRDRLSVLTGAILLGLALARFLEGPVRPLAISVLGSPLGVNLSATTIMLLVITGMSIAGAESLVRSHSLARQGQLRHSFIFWIVPGLLGLAIAGWLYRIENVGPWVVTLLASGILIPLTLAAEFAAVDPEKRSGTLLQWGQMILIHLIAVMLFTQIYALSARSLLSGTAVTLVATLLAARLFWPLVRGQSETLIYGAAVGFILGQMTWVLNYWPLSELRGGLLLLLVFYIVTGLMQQFLHGRFDRQVVLEYSGVTLVALLLIALTVG